MGMPPSKVAPWRAPQLTLTEAFNLRNAVKARYSFADWLKVAKPLQDSLREKQRTALVSYLWWRDKLDSNELFDRYLIDVEMSPCQLTSRIKQAIGAVQLFIQRMSLLLEWDQQAKPLLLKEPQATWWHTWMHSYRVWEANRKVFLYAENWIEPELRDDKTPFFKELEKELKQNEVTADQADDRKIKGLSNPCDYHAKRNCQGVLRARLDCQRREPDCNRNHDRQSAAPQGDGH